MELMIVTGMSGAGKSQAVKALEDIGYYCVDNMPPTLMLPFLQLCQQSSQALDKVALVAITVQAVLEQAKVALVEMELILLMAMIYSTITLKITLAMIIIFNFSQLLHFYNRKQLLFVLKSL